MVRFMETESRIVLPGVGGGEREWGRGGLVFKGDSFHLEREKGFCGWMHKGVNVPNATELYS